MIQQPFSDLKVRRVLEVRGPDAAAVEIVRGIHERARRARSGEIRRRDAGWPFRLGLEEEPWGETWKGFLLIRRIVDIKV